MPVIPTAILALSSVLMWADPPLALPGVSMLPKANAAKEAWAANLVEAYRQHEYISFTAVVETSTRTSTPANVEYEETSRFRVRMGKNGRIRTELIRNGRCVWTLITNGTDTPSVMEWNATRRTVKRALPTPDGRAAPDGTVHTHWLDEHHSGCDVGGLIRSWVDPSALVVGYWTEMIRSSSSIRSVNNDLGMCIEVDRTNDPIGEILHLDIETGLVIRRETLQYPQEYEGEKTPFFATRRTYRDFSFAPIPDDVFEFGPEDERKAGKEVCTKYPELPSPE